MRSIGPADRDRAPCARPTRRLFVRSLLAGPLLAALATGCAPEKPPEYGYERPLVLPGNARQIWAVAPVIDLSGQRVDPVLEADTVYGQLQQVAGLSVLPVNRVIQVYEALRIAEVSSEGQAAAVCEALGADALLVTTVTAYDPYDPPKLGAAMTLLRRDALAASLAARREAIDVRALTRRASEPAAAAASPRPAPPAGIAQAVGMFDAANGSVRAAVLAYAKGRNDPTGPLKERAYLLEMSRYGGFVYHTLIEELLRQPGAAAGR